MIALYALNDLVMFQNHVVADEAVTFAGHVEMADSQIWDAILESAL